MILGPAGLGVLTQQRHAEAIDAALNPASDIPDVVHKSILRQAEHRNWIPPLDNPVDPQPEPREYAIPLHDQDFIVNNFARLSDRQRGIVSELINDPDSYLPEDFRQNVLDQFQNFVPATPLSGTAPSVLNPSELPSGGGADSSVPDGGDRNDGSDEPVINDEVNNEDNDSNQAEEGSPSEGESAKDSSSESVTMVQALEILYPKYDIVSLDEALFLVTHSAMKVAKDDTEPWSLAEAMTRPDTAEYLEAAKKEIQAHVDNGTWELVKLPKDRKAIGSRWVFRIKRDAEGNIERYKGRLVAKGISQRPGFDYIPDQVTAPVMRFAAIRSIIALAAINDWEADSVDISNAYLNGVLPDDQIIYMKQPEGFHQGDNNWVCRLRRGLYGLKQLGRLWYQRLGQVPEKNGLTKLVSDPSIYIWEGPGVKVIVPVFVDDIQIFSKLKERKDKVKQILASEFKIRDLGPINFLLSMAVTRDRKCRTIQLSQRQYILDLLERFGMSNSVPVDTPMVPGSSLSKDNCPQTEEEMMKMQNIPYATAVGALNYLAVATRPDIAYTVHKLAQFNSNPGPRMWTAVKHLLRYLKGTLDLKLTYAPDESTSDLFTTYTDADYGGDKDTGKSRSGYVIKIGTGAVSWASKQQGPIAKSSTEAEFYGASFAGTELKWMRNLLSEVGFPIDGPSPLHIDNQSTIQGLNDTVHHSRMKHIAIAQFWIRNEVTEGNIEMHYCPTAHMPADLLTKPLTKFFVQRHRKTMGLME